MIGNFKQRSMLHKKLGLVGILMLTYAKDSCYRFQTGCVYSIFLCRGIEIYVLDLFCFFSSPEWKALLSSSDQNVSTVCLYYCCHQ